MEDALFVQTLLCWVWVVLKERHCLSPDIVKYHIGMGLHAAGSVREDVFILGSAAQKGLLPANNLQPSGLLTKKSNAMAKSENPLDVYRKQQRKKEVKKNKTARIKVRDEKVAATRSVEDVK